jgi:alkylation response protein AidB-like acyl-CoA dehydrogenase
MADTTTSTEQAGGTASFTRGIYAGAVHDSLLFPYPEPLDRSNPTEAKLVRTLIGELRRIEREMIDSERFDEEEGLPEKVVQALAEARLLALTIPVEYGGLGLSSTAYSRVFGTLSTIDPGLAVLVGVHCGLGAKAIVRFGNEEQKARYLPMLARGETLAAYALTEPETGSDAQNIKTIAEVDGDDYVINGRKIWIGNGQRAGVIVTFAQTTVERRGEHVLRPTAFIIRPDMPGFVVDRTIRKLGVRSSTQAELTYRNLRVPRDHVLGTPGRGFTVAVNVLNAGRLTLAAGTTGGTRHLLGHMTRYAEQRIQFQHPLADFEITQRKLSEIASNLYASEAMLGHLAMLADRPDSDFALEAACAKVFASELLWLAADEMVQVAGGRGYVKPYPYERLLRDARINRIFEGANEVLRLFIALNGIQGPAERLKQIDLRNPMKSLGLLSGLAASRIRSVLGATATFDVELHERLNDHKRYFEQHVVQLKDATERMIMRHRKQIIERQLVLERLANMGIDLYATACVIARTQHLIAERGVEACARELALCDLFCIDAGKRFRRNRLALDAREDDLRRTVAADVRAAVGYGVTDVILELGALDQSPKSASSSLT